ncbi:MAG: trypsin-like peptidase domain-containing protein [Bacteroidia bacterium]
MKSLNLTLICVLSVIISGCASILNPKMQTVTVHTGHEETKVYVYDEMAATGDEVLIKLERNAAPKQLKFERDGYKPEYFVVHQNKKSPLYLLSVVPFGVLIYPMFYDIGRKAFNYDKLIAPTYTPVEIRKRQENEKYIYLSTTALNVPKEKFRIENVGYRQYIKNKSARSSDYGTEDISMENSIFSDMLNDILKSNGYVDTVESIYRGKNNTLYVNAEVTDITFRKIRTYTGSHYFNFFIVTEATTTWEVLDVYKQPQYKTAITTSSGEFSSNYGKKDNEFIVKSMEDAITASFFQLLQDAEVREILKVGDANIEMENISLKRPSTTQTLQDAMAATVTIVHDDGHGSGCVITSDGYVLTNYHVVAGHDKAKVVLNDGSEVDYELIRYNDQADLALIKIDKKFSRAFDLSNNSSYLIGNEIYAIGTPNSVELGQTLSKGIISGIRKKEGVEWIQTDASVNPGNSGGPLVTKDGRLIGVVNSKLVGFGIEGIAFSIPAKQVSEYLFLDFK